MKINDWLLSTGTTTRAFAKIIGATQSAVSKWRQKQRIPRPKMLKKIEKKTYGQVKIQDWFS